MDTQIFVDRLLEVENLTSDLEDAEAKWLLEWGLQQIPLVIEGYTEEEQAGEQIHALMSFMRRINRLAARRASRPVETILEDLQALQQAYAQAFGQSRLVVQVEFEAAAQQLPQTSTLEAIQFLIGLYQP